MVPFDFTYHRPSSIEEAVRLFERLHKQGKTPLYYGGGTEIITLSRLNLTFADAVIDIKHIPECGVLRIEQNELTLGAALSLTSIEKANPFPLLTKAASEVADRTARNQITLGGNVCGQIFYRETVLPLLLADCHVVIAGKEGLKQRSIHEVFQQRMRLEHGEFLVQVKIDLSYVSLPHAHTKRRKQGKIGYPLVTVAAIKKDERLRVAFSGVCPFPFRSKAVEEQLNARHLPIETRISRALQYLPKPILNDTEGSVEYRLFVLMNALSDILIALEEG
ncbi:FAD binding domain-containing protein [Anoxybacillus sp. J5B_2022]|uniref:FAD binding domain-containing protein n=1 Tax=Anoxybacillus sp. J5B_2022 TaxID=3003246 RepID=UPI002285A42D|nr:FAD binding domain-containing protein [Anoxybacillus sp. J5B_2022]MCZ0755645.1 FAD binding domain-containing protein [Anoxybacillus sp. J5B_2022]